MPAAFAARNGRDGHPVAGVTYARLDAYAAPVDGQYRFAIKFRGNGPAYDGNRYPLFPSQPMIRGDSVPVEFVSGPQFKTSSKSEALALAGRERKERAARNESCEIAMGLRDKADRQVAIDSPFKPTFTN